MTGIRTNSGRYEIFDRLYWLMSKQEFTANEYYAAFGRSRGCFVRDIEHLRNFYGMDFFYDQKKKVWENVGNNR